MVTCPYHSTFPLNHRLTIYVWQLRNCLSFLFWLLGSSWIVKFYNTIIHNPAETLCFVAEGLLISPLGTSMFSVPHFWRRITLPRECPKGYWTEDLPDLFAAMKPSSCNLSIHKTWERNIEETWDLICRKPTLPNLIPWVVTMIDTLLGSIIL